jgi:hypothetical protein
MSEGSQDSLTSYGNFPKGYLYLCHTLKIFQRAAKTFWHPMANFPDGCHNLCHTLKICQRVTKTLWHPMANFPEGCHNLCQPLKICQRVANYLWDICVKFAISSCYDATFVAIPFFMYKKFQLKKHEAKNSLKIAFPNYTLSVQTIKSPYQSC